MNNNSLQLNRSARQQKPALNLSADRLPPHSIEAEQGVLGCILLSPNECLPDALERFGPFPEAFYDLRHREIFSHMARMFQTRRAVDPLTLQERLAVGDKLEAVGGLVYLTSLPDSVSSALNFSAYADIVWEKYRLRKMIQACSGAVAKAFEWTGEVDDLISQIERDVLAAGEQRTADWLKPLAFYLQALSERLDSKHYRGKGLITGIPSGLAHLDKHIHGFHNGEMIVIAAEPKRGKTAMMMNLVEHIAVKQRLACGVFSMEMTGEALALRALCARSGASFQKVQTGFASGEELDTIRAVRPDFESAEIFIDESSCLDEVELRARARRLVHRAGCKILFVDYLQIARSMRANNRYEVVTNVSGAIKAIAKDNNVPVVVLSQFNRDKERRGRRPDLNDLRESGAIGQDADVVLMLHEPIEKEQREVNGKKEWVTLENQPEDEVWRMNLYIAAQRNGPTFDCELIFRRACMKFEDRYGGQGKSSRDLAHQ